MASVSAVLKYNKDTLKNINSMLQGPAIKSVKALSKLDSAVISAGLAGKVDLSLLPSTITSLTIDSMFVHKLDGLESLPNLESLTILSSNLDELHLGNELENLRYFRCVTDDMVISVEEDSVIELKTLILEGARIDGSVGWTNILNTVKRAHICYDQESDEIEYLKFGRAEEISITMNSNAIVIIDAPMAVKLTLDGWTSLYGHYIRYNPEVIKELNIVAERFRTGLIPSASLEVLHITTEKSSQELILSKFPNLIELSSSGPTITGNEVSLPNIKSLNIDNVQMGVLHLDNVEAVSIRDGGIYKLDITSPILDSISILEAEITGIDVSASKKLRLVNCIGVFESISLPDDCRSMKQLNINTHTSNERFIINGAKQFNGIEGIGLISNVPIIYKVPEEIDLEGVMVVCPNYSEVVDGIGGLISILGKH